MKKFYDSYHYQDSEKFSGIQGDIFVLIWISLLYTFKVLCQLEEPDYEDYSQIAKKSEPWLNLQAS